MKTLSKILFAALMAMSTAALADDIVSVSGTGQLSVSPDVVYVDLSVVTSAKTAAEAQTLNAQQSQPLFAMFTSKYALVEKDVKTTSYNISPVYSTVTVSGTSTEEVTGYTVTNSLRVTIRDLKTVDQFIDDSGQTGANQIKAVTFATEKEAQYQKQALTLALQDARAKADVVAQTTGQAIVKVSKVTVSDYTRPVMAYDINARMGAPAPGGAKTNISSGDLTVSINVSVDYLIQ